MRDLEQHQHHQQQQRLLRHPLSGAPAFFFAQLRRQASQPCRFTFFHLQMWHRVQDAPSLQPLPFQKYLHDLPQSVGCPTEPTLGGSSNGSGGCGTPSFAWLSKSSALERSNGNHVGAGTASDLDDQSGYAPSGEGVRSLFHAGAVDGDGSAGGVVPDWPLGVHRSDVGIQRMSMGGGVADLEADTSGRSRAGPRRCTGLRSRPRPCAGLASQ